MPHSVISESHRIRVDTFRQSLLAAVEHLPGNLHLWQFDLERPYKAQENCCSEEEVRRARGFASRSDGKLFLESRVLLREILGAYTGIPPEKLTLVSVARRKPFVRGSSITFNISHSGVQLAIAIRSSGLVGVDIQQVKQVQDLALARSAFYHSEVRFLEGLPERERRMQFFRLWVCREAVLKMVGVGFEGRGLALQKNSDGNYRVVTRPSGWGDIELAEFAGPEGFLGAVAWSPQATTPRIDHFIVS